MRALREKTKAIILTVGIAFVGLMVFQWGMDITGRSTGFPQEIGRVNGTPITYEQWTRAFQSLSDAAREERGGRLTDDESREVEEATWNALVNEILIQQELERLGIQVADAEIRLAFRTAPPPQLLNHPAFQTDGRFDYEKYRQYFASPAADRQLLLEIENYYRSVLPRTRLFEQVSVGIYVTDAELWEQWRDRNEQVRVLYVAIEPRTLVPDDSVSATEQELRRHYDEHRAEFRRERSADVAVLSVLKQPGPEDTAAALAKARALRDSIVRGADFGEIARRESADAASREAGGDLGFIHRGDLVAPLAEAAFAMRVGGVSEPLTSSSGVHLLKVAERRGDEVRASHVLIPIRMTAASEESLLARVDRMEQLALRRGVPAAADSLGLPVLRAGVSEGSDFIPGVGSLRTAVEWALHDSTRVGDVSPVYETRSGYHILELRSRSPAGTIPYEEVRAAVERRVKLEKKKAKARRLAESIVASVRAGRSLEAAAREHGLEIRTTPAFTRQDVVPDLGQANAAIGTAFGLSLGRVSDVVEANDRFTVLQLVQRMPADRQAWEAQKESQRAQAILQRRQRQRELWMTELRERAKIRDFRRRVSGPPT